MFEDWIDEERPKINIWMALSRGEARELLQELAVEGSPFREALASDPRKALSRLPLDIHPSSLPERIELPPAEHFAQLIETLARDDYAEPSVPAGYALFMLVLPFGCPTTGD
jgi:hypothetical protein